MKNVREKFVKLTGIGVFAVLVFATLTTVTVVGAKTQPAPPCCVDRWDPDWTGRDRWEPHDRPGSPPEIGQAPGVHD